MGRPAINKQGVRLIKIRLQIHGKVQGVFYRQSAREVAKILALDGWIKNNPDGTVEAEAVGTPEAVDGFLAWCQKGPPRATIDRVHIVAKEDLSEAPPAKDAGLGFQIVG